MLPCEDILIFLYPLVLTTLRSLKLTSSIPWKIDTNILLRLLRHFEAEKVFFDSCVQNSHSERILVSVEVYKCQQTLFPNLAQDQQVAPANETHAKLLKARKRPHENQSHLHSQVKRRNNR